jgi:ribonuclease HI
MSKKAPKFYVVWQGRQTGVFSDWNSCRAQTDGFDNAKYKAFASREEAERAFAQDHKLHVGGKPQINNNGNKSQPRPIVGNYTVESIAVDGAWNTRTGEAEYQGVYVKTGELLFHQGPFADASNNIVEFLGIVHGLAFLKKQNSNVPIYSDSMTAISWVRNKKCKTTIEAATHNQEIFDLIERAEKWLQTNTYQNLVIKWRTDVWGEIPADFGRK